jgi:hypothetical protein
MTTTILDSKNNLTFKQLRDNSSNQFKDSCVKENVSVNDIYFMHKNKESNKNVNINNLFKIFHQNIRGLKGKINEFMFSVFSELPHINCLTEHHLKDYEIDITPITKYKLGAKYCRKILKNGGVCIYIQEYLKF